MLEFTINCWALHSFFILDKENISNYIYDSFIDLSTGNILSFIHQ